MNQRFFQELVVTELSRARQLHKPYNSAHEAYAVILEELEEFWDEVKKKSKLRDHKKMLEELVQISVTAQRAAEDLHLIGESQ